MSVEVKNLTKVFGQQRAVDNISFRVEPGQILGFLGPTSGTILVNGRDVTASPVAVRRSVGYLPEHNPLYLDMYVKEYLEFVGNLHGLKGKRLSARIGEMV